MIDTFNRKQGFTIVEVVVSTMVFLIAAAGIFATISSLSAPAGESNRDVAGALVAKQALENLRNDVDMTDWDSGELSVGSHGPTSVVVDGITYTINYIVAADTAGSDARRVDMTISW